MFKLEPVGQDVLLHNKYGLFSRNNLLSLFQEQRLTIKKLALSQGLKPYQMLHVLRLLKISYRNALNDTRVTSSEISPEMHQILLGTLLGDAYMRHPKAYQVAHSIFQADYLYNIAEALAPFVATVGDRSLKTGDCTHFWTYRHDALTPYYKRFYSNGSTKKFINQDTLAGLGPQGLAYWYMDDGKFDEYGAYLCVGNISASEGHTIVSFLKEVFSIESVFQVHNREKNHFNIYIKACSRGLFFNLIEPYIIPSMRYKLTGEAPVRRYSVQEQIERHKNLCQKVGRMIRYKGSL